MTDLISRADAIEAVHKYFVKEIDKTPHEIDEDGDDVYTDMPTVNSLLACNKELSKALKALPSAEAKTKCVAQIKVDTEEIVRRIKEEYDITDGWIPCSERLPGKDELVLVTVWNGITIAWRNIYGGWESAEDMYGKGDVTAWMPLPTPYKGGEDNNA